MSEPERRPWPPASGLQMGNADEMKEFFSDRWNCFLVKLLRQLGHNYSIFYLLGLLVLLQLGLLLLSDGKAVWGNEAPFGLIILSAVCGVGSMFLLLASFYGNQSGLRSTEKDTRWRHFLDLSPLKPWRVVACLILAYTFFFLASVLISSPVLLISLLNHPGWSGKLPFLLLMVYAGPLTLVLIMDRDSFRVENFLIFLAILQLLFSYEEHHPVSFLPGSALALSALLGYGILAAHSRLLPAAAERDRWLRCGQLGLLLIMLLYWRSEHFGGFVLGLLAVIGSVASLADSAVPVSDRMRRAIPDSRIGRLHAFVFFGASSGGRVWCLLAALSFAAFCRLRQADEIFGFLLVWSLLSGEVALLTSRYLSRCLKKWDRRTNLAISYQVAVFLLLSLGFAAFLAANVAFNLSSERLVPLITLWLIPVYVLLLLLQWRRLWADIRLFLIRPGKEAA